MSRLHRPGDAYAIWVFWHGPAHRFARWYANLQAPFRRTRIGLDTMDHELDLWSADGATWHWKDDARLDQRVDQGWFTESEAEAIRADARRFEGEMARSGPWWDDAWASWRPPEAWGPGRLPAGWEDV